MNSPENPDSTNNNGQPENRNFSSSSLMVYYLATIAVSVIAVTIISNYFKHSQLHIWYLGALSDLSSVWLTIFNFEHTRDSAWTTKYLDTIYTKSTAVIYLKEELVGPYTLAIVSVAMLLWPGNWIKKITAAVAGIVLLILLDGLRVAMNLVIDEHHPLWFAAFNDWVNPGLYALCGMLVFFAWVQLSGKHPRG